MIEALILIGLLILYIVSLYRAIISIVDWDILTEAQRMREILIFFLVSTIVYIAFNILAQR